MYQNYRNFDVVEVQIMDIYLLKPLIWLIIFCTSALLGVDKKPLGINQRELIKEIDFNIFTCKKDELVVMNAVNVKYSVSVLIMIQYFSCFVIHSVFSPWVELITNNLNIWTAEKNQNRSTFKECKI